MDRKLSSFKIDMSAGMETVSADIASVLGMNCDYDEDSNTAVIYLGTDKTNGFFLKIVNNNLAMQSYASGSQLSHTHTLNDSLYYIKNDAETSCVFGDYYNSQARLYFAYFPGKDLDGNDVYIFANVSNGSAVGGKTLWSTFDVQNDSAFTPVMSTYSDNTVSLAPLALKNSYSEDAFYEVVGKRMNEYQIISLDGYDYLISSQDRDERIHFAILLGESS